ncbi:MAG: hypothetical protein JWQ38_3499 [Flavipsychrobacter sp.]|nr:hypothetical protein [Flavipsychrobacter sp.]
MRVLRNIVSNEYLLVFLFCLAVITGPAIAILFEHNLLHFPDCQTYMGLAHFDLAQSAVRRYRVIIPFAAAAINALFGPLIAKFSPSYFANDYSLAFSFFLVNTLLTAFYGVLIYRYCKAFGVSRASAVIGTLAMLTCRYTIYMAAYPLVDSLFCVVIAMTLCGLKEKNTTMLLWAVFLGPFSKESFIFIAPLIFFFSHIDKKKLLLYFLASGVLVFAYRYIYDVYAPVSVMGGLKADMSHVPNLVRNLPKLLSLSTFFKILMNTGFWIAAPLLVFFISPTQGKFILRSLDRYLIWFMLSVVLQMLLSGSMERMFYLAMPVLCVIVALSADELGRLFHKSEEKRIS